MLDLKPLFEGTENGMLSFVAFEKLLKDKGIKLADLAEGNYVSKQKYDDDIKSKDTQITSLNSTITQRDTDLADLKQKLTDAGTDSAKLTQLSTDLSTLQGKYDADTQALRTQLDKQAYEFATREFVNTKQFTSNAAKRDFSRSLLEAQLKMADGKILGADDFVAQYSKDNADAFVVENPNPTPDPDGGATPPPHFVQPTQGNNNPGGEQNPFAGAFNFSYVRPKPNN